MDTVFRSHRLEIVIDDETWAALGARALARHECPSELIVYAIEQWLEHEGFVPGWALLPTGVVPSAKGAGGGA